MKLFDKLREPVNGLTHLAGMFLAIFGTWLLVSRAVAANKTTHILSFAVFGLSLVALYLASALYHLLKVSDAKIRILRRIDHIMIFVFIAGTYTPVCLIALKGSWGWSLLAVIWGVAVIGIVLKTFWLQAPRRLSVTVYLIAGWLAAIAVVPLLRALPAWGIAWILFGGFFYSAGALIYGVKRPNPFPGVFGFHEIWHIFVLAGSFSHFYLMWRYIMPMG
jgi:hemolysin III